MSDDTYTVGGYVVLTRDNAGKQLASFSPAGTDLTFPLAEQDTPFWCAWFDKLDQPRREREAWHRSPHNPNGSFEEHDPEDARREACEEVDHRE